MALAMPSEEVRSSLAFPALAGSDRGEPGVSPLPNVAQEIERTKLVDTVIKKALAENGYEIVRLDKMLHLKPYA